MKFDTGFLNFKRQIKILFLASFFSFISSTVFAQGASIEKGNLVRVGWFESQFCQTTPDGSLSGYAYEYQQNIAAYTGWKYEYVKGSWAKLFEMLKKGEIDLLADVYFTDEHSKEIIYSENPMGFEPYYIFVSRKNNEITPANLFTLNGKKVGVYKNSYQEELFKNYKPVNDKLRYDIVEIYMKLFEAHELYLNKEKNFFKKFKNTIIEVSKQNNIEIQYVFEFLEPWLLGYKAVAERRFSDAEKYYKQAFEKRKFALFVPLNSIIHSFIPFGISLFLL